MAMWSTHSRYIFLNKHFSFVADRKHLMCQQRCPQERKLLTVRRLSKTGTAGYMTAAHLRSPYYSRNAAASAKTPAFLLWGPGAPL